MKQFLVLCSALLATACASNGDRPQYDLLLGQRGVPDSAIAYADYLTARYAVLVEDPEIAAERYKRRLAREPENSEVLEKAVYAQLLSGDFNKAADLARNSRSRPVGVAPFARMVTSIDAYLNGDYELVVSLLDGKDLGVYNAALANLLIAWSLAANGDVEAGLARLTGESDAFVRRVNGFSQAYILAHADRKDEALTMLDLGWSQGLRLPIAQALQLRLLIEAGRMDDARQILEQVDVDSASNTLLYDIKSKLDRNEDFPPVELSAGQGAALSLVGPVATLSHNSVRDLSIVYLELVRALDPEFRGVAIMLADRLGERGRDGQAMQLLNSIPASSPYYAAAQVQRGWICRKLEDETCGRAAMEAALSASPSRAIKLQTGDYFRAIEDYARAELILQEIAAADASARQDDWRVLFALGASRERLGKWELAEKNLKAALEIAPNRPEVLNYLGYSWIDRGENIPAALVMIRKALGQRPDAGYIVDSLGWAYYRLGKHKEAVVYLEQAAALDPGDPVINDHLGDAYWRVGMTEQARYQWSRVKLLDPDEEMLQSVQRKIEQGLQVLKGAPDGGTNGAQNGELH